MAAAAGVSVPMGGADGSVGAAAAQAASPARLQRRVARLAVAVGALAALMVLGGNLLAGIVLLVTSICAYRATRKPNVRALRWFIATNVCCALLVLVGLIVALVVLVPVEHCSCRTACVNSVYDLLQDWENRTAAANAQGAAGWIDMAGSLNMTDDDGGGSGASEASDAEPEPETGTGSEAETAPRDGLHRLLARLRREHHGPSHRHGGHRWLRALWRHGDAAAAAAVGHGPGRVGRDHSPLADKYKHGPDKYGPSKHWDDEDEEDDKGEDKAGRGREAVPADEFEDPGQAWLVRMLDHVRGLDRSEFQRASRDVCKRTRGGVIAVPIIGGLLLLLFIAAARSARRLRRHPWFVAQDEQRRLQIQLRRQEREHAAAMGYDVVALPPAAQYWYTQAAAAQLQQARGGADGGGSGGGDGGSGEGGAPAVAPAEPLYRFVPGVCFVSVSAPPARSAVAVPPPPYAPYGGVYAMPPAQAAAGSVAAVNGGASATDDLRRAVSNGLRAGGNALTGLAARVRAAGAASRGYGPVPTVYDTAEPQLPAQGVVVGASPNVAGSVPASAPPTAPPGSAYAYTQ